MSLAYSKKIAPWPATPAKPLRRYKVTTFKRELSERWPHRSMWRFADGDQPLAYMTIVSRCPLRAG